MANEITKVEALQSLTPNAEWVLRGDVVEWIGGGTEPTALELSNEVTRLQAVYDSQEYARARATEYSALNQFEMQFDDQQNNTTTWVDAINDIKARFPK